MKRTTTTLGILGVLALLTTGCEMKNGSQPLPEFHAPTALTIQDTIPAPTGTEIGVADVVDGSSGTYHLVQVDYYHQFISPIGVQAAAQIQSTLAANADPSNPNATYQLAASDVSQLGSDGFLQGGVNAPVQITRSAGQFSKMFVVQFLIFSPVSGQAAQQSQGSTDPAIPTLLNYFQSFQTKGQAMHFYRNADQSLEIRLKQDVTNLDGNRFITERKLTYVLVP